MAPRVMAVPVAPAEKVAQEETQINGGLTADLPAVAAVAV